MTEIDKKLAAEYNAYMQLGSSPCEDCDNYGCKPLCKDAMEYYASYWDIVNKLMKSSYVYVS